MQTVYKSSKWCSRTCDMIFSLHDWCFSLDNVPSNCTKVSNLQLSRGEIEKKIKSLQNILFYWFPALILYMTDILPLKCWKSSMPRIGNESINMPAVTSNLLFIQSCFSERCSCQSRIKINFMFNSGCFWSYLESFQSCSLVQHFATND